MALSLGCATSPGREVSAGYQYFAKPNPADAWSPKIAGWQSRERALPDIEELEAPASVSGSGVIRGAAKPGSSLRDKYSPCVGSGSAAWPRK